MSKLLFLLLLSLALAACAADSSDVEERLSRLESDAQYFADADNVDRRLTDLDKSIESVQGDLANLESYQVSDLQADVDQMQVDLDGLIKSLCSAPNLGLRC